MSLAAILGLLFLLCALLGLVGVIGTPLVAEIALAVIGLALLAYASGRLRI